MEVINVQATPYRLNDNQLIKHWLRFAGVSDKSVATYAACLRQLHNYFKANGIVNPIREDLENWRDSLIASGKSASTIQLYLSAVKLFFRYLAQEQIYPNVADNLKSRVKISNAHKKDALSAKQASTLVKAVKGNSIKDLRDRAILMLMVTTGLRTIEVSRADICDIRHIEGNAYLYVQGKGRSDKSECVLLAPKVMQALKDYLKARGKVGKNEPLFVSHSRRNYNCRLDTQTIRKMVKEQMRSIDIDSPTLTAHSLRHTAATVMILQKQKLTDVQMVLRHKSIATTMIYNNAVNRIKCRAELVAAETILC